MRCVERFSSRHTKFSKPSGLAKARGMGWHTGVEETFFRAQAGQTYLFCVGQSLTRPCGLTGLRIEEHSLPVNVAPARAAILKSEIRVIGRGTALANDDGIYYWKFPVPRTGLFKVSLATFGNGELDLIINGSATNQQDFNLIAGSDFLLGLRNANSGNDWGGKFAFLIRAEYSPPLEPAQRSILKRLLELERLSGNPIAAGDGVTSISKSKSSAQA
ncbi:MAG: hypothetical protein ACI9MB_004130 [Verrucomicrobiales bacterium]|jgi:hypothetical protein